MKYSLEFYRKNWNKPLIQHIRKIVNGVCRFSSEEETAKFISDLSVKFAPEPNSFEETLDMVKKIRIIKEESI